MNTTRYDAHCHIFTLKYLLKEAKSLVHDILHGTYPLHYPKQKKLLASSDKWADIKNFLRQLYELVRASATSEEENLLFLQKEAKKAFPSDNLRIIPLMMDIFYMLTYPLDKNQDIVKASMLKSAPINEQDFQEVWNTILDDFINHIRSIKNTRTDKLLTFAGDKLDKVLEVIEEERAVKPLLKIKSSEQLKAFPEDFYRTEGFCYHMTNLMDLVKNYKDDLFPFIAIDPRREGIIDELLTGSFFNGESRFYGVKLYPRMGYHPQCKPMDAVYNYCSENNIPITFHCGKSGFPPGENWAYAQFGNPINFEPIVKKYPQLKIDFAHLGSSSSMDWANTIVRLINENDNVYTDLSCYTKPADLDKIFPFWENNPKMRDRVLFGTDFDVMYFTASITMQGYYSNFESRFSDADLLSMMQVNPTRFLFDKPL